MKYISIILLLLFIWCQRAHSQPTNSESKLALKTDILFTSKHFSFHNNKWMNLHHFFYEYASNRQKKHLEEDGKSFVDIDDSIKVANLSHDEKILFKEGIQFYMENIIDKPLLKSRATLKWLQNQSLKKPITDTTFSQAFTQILNRLTPLYEKHFWKKHQEQNKLLVDSYIDLIKSTEDFVIAKMENLSGSHWKGIVRVDITTYGNWASAYSPDFDNIVISSADPMMHSSLFMEFVYHESSHLLFLRSSPFRASIDKKSKELKIKPPRNLWHASMFYLSGLATIEVLETKNIPHELIMEKKNVFKVYYNSKEFKAVLSKYYKNEISNQDMAVKLLNWVSSENND